MPRTVCEIMKGAVQQPMDGVMDDFSLQVRLAFLGDACMSEGGTCMCAPYTYTAEYNAAHGLLAGLCAPIGFVVCAGGARLASWACARARVCTPPGLRIWGWACGTAGAGMRERARLGPAAVRCVRVPHECLCAQLRGCVWFVREERGWLRVSRSAASARGARGSLLAIPF